MRRPSEAGRKRRSSELDTSTGSTSSECTDEITSAKRKRSMPRHTPPPEDEEITLEDLENALKKDDYDKGFVKKAMKTTYQARRTWLLQECPLVQEVLEKFPVLNNKKYVN